MERQDGDGRLVRQRQGRGGLSYRFCLRQRGGVAIETHTPCPHRLYNVLQRLRTHIVERMVVCRRADDDSLGFNILSVLRSARGGPFLPDDVSRLESFADVLMSIIEKHDEVRIRQPSVTEALASIADVERCIARAPEAPPRREIEVCARIVFGLSSNDIAADLGIGEQSVATYRKRAYQRLGIPSRRDLMLWYLALWQSGGGTSGCGRRQ